ncbi:hypothetical protein DFH06DRAFT_1126237 [Mycena polygramma]|nr:hypothetical protein DFH06DRAFT_1126237 [Mycena polygramma]
MSDEVAAARVAIQSFPAISYHSSPSKMVFNTFSPASNCFPSAPIARLAMRLRRAAWIPSKYIDHIVATLIAVLTTRRDDGRRGSMPGRRDRPIFSSPLLAHFRPPSLSSYTLPRPQLPSILLCSSSQDLVHTAKPFGIDLQVQSLKALALYPSSFKLLVPPVLPDNQVNLVKNLHQVVASGSSMISVVAESAVTDIARGNRFGG